MIVLDTNVISELQGRMHSERLLRWLGQQDHESVYLTAIAVGEICYGLELLAEGRRKSALFREFSAVLAVFEDRVFSFSLEAAHRYGKLLAHRKSTGRSMEVKDAMIAAICLSTGAALATRNTKDFEGLDLVLINPFEDH